MILTFKGESIVQIRLDNLLNHKGIIEIVAKWLYYEFSRDKKDVTLSSVTERLNNRKMNEIPLSILALVDDKPVGVVSIFENDLRPDCKLTPWLAGLYVDKEYRNKGIAKLLINEVIKISKELGYDEIYLRTEHTGEYYKKIGWIFVEDTIDEYGQKTSVFKYKLIKDKCPNSRKSRINIQIAGKVTVTEK